MGLEMSEGIPCEGLSAPGVWQLSPYNSAVIITRETRGSLDGARKLEAEAFKGVLRDGGLSKEGRGSE